MLEKYEHILYKTEAEKNKAEELYLKEHYDEITHSYEPDLIFKDFILSVAAEEGSYATSYYFYKVWREGKALFDLAAEKYGKPLWEGLAWRDCDCAEKCPFGDGCEDLGVEIDGQTFCKGQIYHYKISLKDITDKINNNIPCYLVILRRNIKHLLCGNNFESEHYREVMPRIFDDIREYFYFFGELRCDITNNRVYGENIISLLEQDTP